MICPKCGEEYYPLPFFSDGTTCPYCAARKARKATRRTNAVLDIHARELAHYERELNRLAKWNAQADDGGK